MLNFLKGKRTYIVVIVGIIVNGAVAMNLIPNEYIDLVNTILIFLGLGTIRSGITSTVTK